MYPPPQYLANLDQSKLGTMDSATAHRSVGSGGFCFNSSEIGVTTARPKDFFAEQNRKAVDSKRRSTQKRKKIVKYFSLVLCLVVLVGILVIGVSFIIKINQPEVLDAGAMTEESQTKLVEENGEYALGTEEAIKVQEEAEQIILDGGDYTGLGEFFDEKITASEGEAERINLVLLEMQAFYRQNMPEEVILASKKVNYENMTKAQISIYGGLLYSAYTSIGQVSLAQYYYNLSIERGPETGGGVIEIVGGEEE